MYEIDAFNVLGMTYVESGRPDKAVEVLERGFATLEKNQISPDTQAETRFNLAVALWDVGDERERAIALAREARSLTDPKLFAEQSAAIDAWLGERTEGPARGTP